MTNVNLAASTLAIALGGARTNMTATLQTGDGVKFPMNVPYIVLIGSDGDHHQERARCTFVAGDALTIVRGYEGTDIKAWGISTPIALEAVDVWGVGSLTAPLILKANAAQPLITSGVIATAGLSVSRVSCAGAVTGAILQAGTVDGQVIHVENTSAANTVTFAAVGTSFVQDGVSDVIAVSTVRGYLWNATTSHWVHVV